MSGAEIFAAVMIATQASAAGDRPVPATPWPACTLTHSADFLDRLQDMPALIQADVRRRLGAIAEPGRPFNSSDVMMDDLPQRRFLRGMRSGSYWFVWYEHGGVGLHRHVLAYQLGVTGSRTDRRPAVALVTNLVGNPCGATDAILDGVASGQEF